MGVEYVFDALVWMDCGFRIVCALVLVWFWHGFGRFGHGFVIVLAMVLVGWSYDFGMILVWCWYGVVCSCFISVMGLVTCPQELLKLGGSLAGVGRGFGGFLLGASY